MHSRTAVGIAVIIVSLVMFLYPRLNDPIATSGSVTITAGATSTTVGHHLGQTPDQIQLTPNGQVVGVSWWADSIGDTTFAVNLSSSTTTSVGFYWRAQEDE